MRLSLWEHTGSNRGPSACKADALNQLSYAPLFGSANISGFCLLQNLFEKKYCFQKDRIKALLMPFNKNIPHFMFYLN